MAGINLLISLLFSFLTASVKQVQSEREVYQQKINIISALLTGCSYYVKKDNNG